MFYLTVEKMLHTFTQDLKSYTEKAMKMEPAAWIKDYEVDMDELYCELTLEKLENKLSGVEGQKLKSYKCLFLEGIEQDEDNTDSCPEKKLPPAKHGKGSKTTGGKTLTHNSRKVLVKGKKQIVSKKAGEHSKSRPQKKEAAKKHGQCYQSKALKCRAKKVLVKGDPGIGKTSFLKRIASDWAKGFFTTFSVVFFVFLKLVKPKDAIENVIINQMPVLGGMGVTPAKLKRIIQNLGERCLLILDGLDEHAFGKNLDVEKIVRGQKLLYTNIILSSRPHSTRNIEKHFPTIIRIEGFTHVEAEKFAFKILSDRSKVSGVLSFNPWSFADRPLQHSPILLSFLCLLVREENFNLLEKGPDIGDLFTRMVRCLFKKFTIRKGVEFSVEMFEMAMVSVGKLALETLVSGNPLMQRSRVIKEGGEDAFDIGWLIGHEDFRLLGDETADIFITFSHRSIQEFLGAFFFIFSLNKGDSVSSLLGDSQRSIFFFNPLFLYFCLWFLYCDQNYFIFSNKLQVCETLRSYVLAIFRNRCNEFTTFDIAKFCPTLDVREAYKRKDKLLLSLLEEVLSAHLADVFRTSLRSVNC